jgi:hypothetical protein
MCPSVVRGGYARVCHCSDSSIVAPGGQNPENGLKKAESILNVLCSLAGRHSYHRQSTVENAPLALERGMVPSCHLSLAHNVIV